jgi:uncharacterized protein YfdQ (DUF2303 family)
MGIETHPEALEKLFDVASEARAIEIINIPNAAGAPGLPTEIPVAIQRGKTPQITSLKSLFDAWRQRPDRKTGTAKVQTLESFIDLTNRHKTVHSAVFADVDWRKPSLQAVIDYHGIDQTFDAKSLDTDEIEKVYLDGNPDNLKHRIAYDYPLSDDWKAWIGNNGEVMDQQTFAAWLEDRIADLASPTDAEVSNYGPMFQTTIATPAQVLGLSRGLEIYVEAKRRSNVVLQSGAGELVFEETHRDANGGKLIVPGLFMLCIAPFYAGEKVTVPVRLRYRPAGERVVWWYQMYRPDQSITERLDADISHVKTETGLPVYEGAPEA